MKIQILQGQVLRATISWDETFCDEQDSYAIVWVEGHLHEERSIWGVDAVQAFTLGMKLIEQLTEERRMSDGERSTDWRIQVEESE